MIFHFKSNKVLVFTFLLAPPSDTLGLVLKSPSKLNIVRFFPLTDLVTFNNLKVNEKKTIQIVGLIG